MRQFKAALRIDVASLREHAATLPTLSEESADAWEQVLTRNEDLSRRLSHLSSYISCLASSDARNEAYVKEEAGLARQRAELAKLRIELLRAVRNVSDEVFSSFDGPNFFSRGRALSQPIAGRSAPDDGC